MRKLFFESLKCSKLRKQNKSLSKIFVRNFVAFRHNNRRVRRHDVMTNKCGFRSSGAKKRREINLFTQPGVRCPSSIRHVSFSVTFSPPPPFRSILTSSLVTHASYDPFKPARTLAASSKLASRTCSTGSSVTFCFCDVTQFEFSG